MTVSTFEQNTKNEQMYSVDELVAKKSVDLLPPNLNQKISIQVISFKEMSEQTPISNEIGHLILFLESVISATNNLDKSALKEIEILFNVNNQKGDVPIGNRRALLLLSSLTKFKDLPVEKIIEVMVKDGMLVGQDIEPNYDLGIKELKKQLAIHGITDDYEVSEIISDRMAEWKNAFNQSLIAKDRTTKLIINLRQKIEDGLSIGLIDCTDGSYISKYKEGDNKTYPNTQAARRLLLSEIAKNRSDQIGGNSLMIPMDNDCLLTESGLRTWLESTYKKEAFLSVPDFVPDESCLDINENSIAEAKIFQQFSDFKMIKGFIKSFLNNQRISFAPFLGSCGFSTSTYKLIKGWDLMDESLGEDARMMTKVIKKADHLSFYPRALIKVSSRIREGSWMGNQDKWKERSRDSYLIKVPKDNLFWKRFDLSNSLIDFDQLVDLLTNLIKKRFSQDDMKNIHGERILSYLESDNKQLSLIRALNALLSSGLSKNEIFVRNEDSKQLQDLFVAVSQLL